MANIGEQLKKEECGWKRFPYTYMGFKFTGNWELSPNTGCYFTTYDGNTCEFYFYGTTFYLISNYWDSYGENIHIRIDEKQYSYSAYSTKNQTHTLIYKAEKLSKGVHHVIIKSNKEGAYCGAGITAIDLDEDGYMCTSDGKYIDITPCMTSNNTPQPYLAFSENGNPASVTQPYLSFDGIVTNDGLGWGSVNSPQGSLGIDFGKKTQINAVAMYSGESEGWCTYMPKEFQILGSNNNVDYTVIKTITNQTNWRILEGRTFEFKTSNYRYYKIKTLNNNNNGNGHTNIKEMKFLLSTNVPFYLINDNGVYKNYDESTQSFTIVDDISILSKDYFENPCIKDLSKIIPLMDQLSDNFKIISNKKNTINIDGLKSNLELIIPNGTFSTKLARNIDNFNLIHTIKGNGLIKCAFSDNKGMTWKVWNNGNWETLTNTTPMKEYSSLNSDELAQWNNLKNEIIIKGFVPNNNEEIDYNLLESDELMVAYAIKRPAYEDIAEMNSLQFKFDAHGTFTLLDNNSVTIEQGVNIIKVTSKKSMDLMKVNIGSSGTVINQTQDPDYVISTTIEEMDQLISKGWEEQDELKL